MALRKATAIAASILMVLVFIRLNGDIHAFIHAVKAGEDATFAFGPPSLSEEEKRELYNRIVAEAETRYIEPIDARIDRVWRAIPGYNGLAVDIERTYEEALKAPRIEPIPFRYKEIEPQIGLKDLGAQPIYRGNPNKRMVSFMINVAWGNEYLDPILETLARENVKATFFLDGSWLKKNVDMAKKIVDAGHELSNHAYSHPDMKNLSRSDQYTQIARTEQLLKEQLGIENRWFAPPSGSYNGATVQIAKEQGLQTVLWTIDTVDWMKPSAESIVRKIDAKLEPGALILMHPTASSRDALAGMIASAKAKGYFIGTVRETLSSERTPAVVEGGDGF
ncbi:polysaccharide deacetylase family protein [Paenibacillus sp. LHD-117]|uniref:polysaccharide deacetylase family protein n=1 Tax=Paenibacillus sp. LHD-117 TaxID=3071412 RepID=UPI0027DF5614|nr:polysaccharide deacetylase family protein [Paenibacillus sp. LHD-117]MDQ6419206.1 polysaccharide deacetylase family protein [Paenibacillus sp. LHD-117]